MAAQNGHLEVVRFLVESGDNQDQGKTDAGATPLYMLQLRMGTLEVSPISGGVGCQQKSRQD